MNILKSKIIYSFVNSDVSLISIAYNKLSES